MKNEKNTEKRFFDQTRFWSPEKCAEELIERTGIDETIWDLRGAVFGTLKALGKFPEDSVGSEHQKKVDQIIARLLEDV